jgi:DNA-binding transcriptional regulator YhcF (GntR family)
MPFIKRRLDQVDVVILIELKRYPPSTMRHIAKIANRSHITIRQRYRWLEQEGYIALAENAAERSARNKILTQKGFEYLAHAGLS